MSIMKSYNNDIFTEFYDNLEDFLKNYISSSYLCVHNNYIKPIHYKSEDCCILKNYAKQPINIPDNVTHLIIEYFYYQLMPKLPPKLLCLDLRGSALNIDVNNLPDSLLYIYWNTDTCLTKLPLANSRSIRGELPPNLISLIVNSWKGAKLTELPNTLTYLSCDVDCIQKVTYFPESLKYMRLILSNKFNFNFELLPNGLTHLNVDIGSVKIKSLDYLPQGLLYLEIENYYNSLDNLPNLIKTLVVKSKCYNKSLDMLPDSIELLVLDNYQNKFIKLPANIKKIIINKDYKYISDLSLLKPDLELYEHGTEYGILYSGRYSNNHTKII